MPIVELWSTTLIELVKFVGAFVDENFLSIVEEEFLENVPGADSNLRRPEVLSNVRPQSRVAEIIF